MRLFSAPLYQKKDIMLQKILILLLLMLFGWLIPPLQAQFKFYPTEQNIGNSHYIRGNHEWQATENGVLLRDLDGNLLQHYTPRNSGLAAANCFSILEESDGTLWVTHEGAGISRLKNGIWTLWNSSTSSNLGNFSSNILQDNTGSIYLSGAIYNQQIARFNGTDWDLVFLPQFGADNQSATIAYDMETDRLGRFWVLTDLGVARLESSGWVTSPKLNNLTKMGFDQQNNLYTVNVFQELTKWSTDFSTSTVVFILENYNEYTRKLFFDANNNLWCLPNIFDGTNLIPSDAPIYFRDAILNQDQLGNIWMTSIRGIYRFDGNVWKAFYEGFVNYSGYFMVKSDAQHFVWISSSIQINRYNSQTKEFKYYGRLTPEIGAYGEYFDVAPTHNGEAWASFRRNYVTNQLLHLKNTGIEAFTDSTTNFGIPSGDIYLLETDALHRPWFAVRNSNYYYGLSYFDGSNWLTFNTNNSPLPSNDIISIERGTGNDIWVSTDIGLAHYDQGNWEVFPPGVGGAPTGEIIKISFAPDGTLWAIVFNNTYSVVTFKDGVWTNLGQNSGGLISSGTLLDIEVDAKNQVWISSVGTGNENRIQRFNGFNWQIFQYFPDFNLATPVYDIETDADGVVWFDSQAAIFTSQNLEKWIAGKIYHDQNLNCAQDTLEAGIGARMVIAENTETAEKEYALSNIDGNYLFNLDSATYKIYSSTANSYWEACSNPITVDFGQTSADSAQVSLGMTADFDCPRMTVSVAAATLRRCFDNTYYVQYCNNGTAIAENAAIDLSFDDDFLVQSSSLPATSQTASSLHFDLGNVEVGACGGFSVVLNLQCDSAQINERRCVKALIFPDSFCNTLPQWSGAEIQVSGVCTGDSVLFTIKNTGSAPSQSLEYVIIDDHVISRDGNFQLNPTQIKEESILADGSAFRLEAEQEPFYPVASFPSATVEGCGPNPNSAFGFQYPEDDASPFVDWECRQVTGSFDPNDKTGFPQGFDNEHFILPGTELEYMIRFQNTGNDTAFNIVVRDTLHRFLEPTSIQTGASSHPYLWNVNELGVLTFYFNDVLLPDSTTNLLGSQGFVRFRIAHKADIVLGSVIPNRAAIFFDFNAPIITNETWHTVDTGFLEKNITTIAIPERPYQSNLLLQVSPNPVGAGEFVYFAKMPIGTHRFLLKNTLGQTIFEANLLDNKVKLPQNLVAGTYFYEVKNIGKGKLVVK
jgi:ligand-binding sensor domain-containing protein